MNTHTPTRAMVRYCLLNDLRLWRARLRVGTATEATCTRERKALQRALAKLRTERST